MTNIPMSRFLATRHQLVNAVKPSGFIGISNAMIQQYLDSDMNDEDVLECDLDDSLPCRNLDGREIVQSICKWTKTI